MGKLSMKRPERVVNLCLDASLQAEWEDADRRLRDARKSTSVDRMVGNTEATALAEQVRELEARMLAEVVQFRLRALPRSEWAKAIAACPPVDADDKSFGANRAALFEQVIPASIVDVRQGDEPVEFDPATDWEPLADEMTDRQFADFADVVLLLNRGEVSVPFSQAASSMSRVSSETSK